MKAEEFAREAMEEIPPLGCEDLYTHILSVYEKLFQAALEAPAKDIFVLTGAGLEDIMYALKKYVWIQGGSGADDFIDGYTLANIRDCLKQMLLDGE